jgi:enoyl-CoA hydratase
MVGALPDARFLAARVEYFSIPWDIGVRQAKELLLQARFISAEEARELGFVDRVIPADRLDDEALAWARRVAEKTRARPCAWRSSRSTRFKTRKASARRWRVRSPISW